MAWKSTVYSAIRHPERAAVLMLRSDRAWGLARSVVGGEVGAGHADLAVPVLERRLGRAVWMYRQIHLVEDMARERIEVVFEAELLEPGSVPANSRWVDRAHLASLPLREERFRAMLDRYLGRLEGGEVPAERPEWCRPGWRQRILPWLEEAVAPARVIGLDQIKQWTISCVVRVRTSGPTYYFKVSALLPLFVDEAAVSVRLGEMFPGFILEPVAHAPTERWMLTADLGFVDDERGIDDQEAAFRRLGRLHGLAAGRVDELLAAGCRDRRLGILATQIEPLLADGRILARLDEADRRRLGREGHRLVEMCAALDDLGIPATLVHGDFHMENLGPGSADSAVIFDWSDACVSHPFFDLQALAWASEGDRPRLMNAYLEAWAPIVAPEQIEQALELARFLTPLHHAVSYKAIADSLDDEARPELDYAYAFLRRVARALGEA